MNPVLPLALAACASLLGGCATPRLGADYRAPDLALPHQWSAPAPAGATAPTGRTVAPLSRWWT